MNCLFSASRRAEVDFSRLLSPIREEQGSILDVGESRIFVIHTASERFFCSSSAIHSCTRDLWTFSEFHLSDTIHICRRARRARRSLMRCARMSEWSTTIRYTIWLRDDVQRHNMVEVMTLHNKFEVIMKD